MTGLSLNQLSALENHIDWQIDQRNLSGHILLPALAYIACISIFLFALSSMDFSLSTPMMALFQISLACIFAACLCLIQTVVAANTTRLATLRLQKPLARAGYILFFSGVIGLMWLGFGTSNVAADMERQVKQIQLFLALVGVVIFIMAYPPYFVRLGNSARQSRVALYVPVLFDLLLLAILFGSISFLHGAGPDLMNEVYCLWLGTIGFLAAFEAVRGRPTLMCMLGERDQANLRFRMGESDLRVQSNREYRLGITLLLVAASTTLMVIATRQWF